MATNINADTKLQKIGVTGSSAAKLLTLVLASTTFTQSRSSGATETIGLGNVAYGNGQILIGGSKTTGDVLTLTVHNSGLTGGQESASYTVQSVFLAN